MIIPNRTARLWRICRKMGIAHGLKYVGVFKTHYNWILSIHENKHILFGTMECQTELEAIEVTEHRFGLDKEE